MDCREFEALVVGARERDRTPSEEASIADHARQCERCAALATSVQRMERALDGLPSHDAPSHLTASIMERVRAARPHEAHWHERWLGALRPPAPAISLSHGLAAIALAIMVLSAGALALHHRGADPLGGPPTVSIAAGAGGPVIEVDSQFVDSLVARHQAAAARQPLSDDESMRLVAY